MFYCIIITALKNKTELCDKLKILAEQENGLNSIISSLLLTPDDCQSRQQVQNVTQFILNWLLGMWPSHDCSNCKNNLVVHFYFTKLLFQSEKKLLIRSNSLIANSLLTLIVAEMSQL